MFFNMPRNIISEDDIEQALLQRLQHVHGFDTENFFTADPANLNDNSRRADKRDVVLADRLLKACVELNPDIPAEVIETQVIPKIMDRRGAMNPVAANRELDGLIHDGVDVEFDDAEGIKQHERVRMIDFDDPAKNHYLAVSQLWIKTTVQVPAARM